ncbi:MFS transporter [Niallia taxi]|uniref:MFS transporter n=1 Tax=Niallia taxi TaxID=2499688 RepID=UPI002E1E8F0F|nr:MFS transporter [Niallia taxi]
MSNTWKIYILAFIGFFVGTAEFVIAGILDKVAESANISVAAAGQLITVFAIAYAFGPPIVMMALAKTDRRKVLMLSLSILVVGSLLTVSLSGFFFLIVARIVLAVGTGVFVVTAMSVAPKLAQPERQAGAISTVFAGFSLALVIGVPIGRIVAESYDWRVIFWAIGLLSLLATFAVAKAIPVTEAEVPVPLKDQLALLKKPSITFALGITLFVFISYSIVNTFMSPFLSTVMSLSAGEISVVFFALGIASLVGSKLGGFLADRIGPIKTISRTMVAQFLALALLSVILSTITGSIIFNIALLMIWAIAIWGFSTTQNFNLVSIAPEASGILLSLNSSVIQIGIAAGAGVGGIVTVQSSMLSITWIGAGSVAIAIFLLVLSSIRNRKLQIEESLKVI